MFQGYTNETFEFFMAIRFNNNRPFFQDNRDWYLRAVREPSIALAQDLSDVVEDMDPELERRPHRVVSRINRDIRFSRDKSPYRDHVWLGWRRPDQERGTAMSLYAEIRDEGAFYGMGFYRENRGIMKALRARIELAPQELLELWRPLMADFRLVTIPHLRIKVPEGTPLDLQDWYTAKGFYLEKTIADFEMIRSSALLEEIKEGYKRLKPLYRYILDLQGTDE